MFKGPARIERGRVGALSAHVRALITEKCAATLVVLGDNGVYHFWICEKILHSAVIDDRPCPVTRSKLRNVRSGAVIRLALHRTREPTVAPVSWKARVHGVRWLELLISPSEVCNETSRLCHNSGA